MSLYSIGIRVLLLTLWTTFLFNVAADGAEPKVVPISHEPGAKAAPKPLAEDIAEADDDGVAYSPQWPEPPQTGALLLKLCVGTALVLGLCVTVLWFGKPWLQKLQVAGTGSSAMHIEGSVAVGGRAMLYLVRIGETQLVAGTDATGLKSLIALPPSFKEVLDTQVPESQPAPISTPLPFNLRAAKRPDSKE